MTLISQMTQTTYMYGMVHNGLMVVLFRVHRVLKVQRAHKALTAQRVLKVLMVQLVLRVLMV